MKNHAGLTGWQLVASVVFIIQGADRLLRTGGTGVFRKCGVSKLYPPPPKKRVVFLIHVACCLLRPRGNGVFRKCEVSKLYSPPLPPKKLLHMKTVPTLGNNNSLLPSLGIDFIRGL